MIGSDVCTLKYKRSSVIMEKIDIKIGFLFSSLRKSEVPFNPFIDSVRHTRI